MVNKNFSSGLQSKELDVSQKLNSLNGNGHAFYCLMKKMYSTVSFAFLSTGKIVFKNTLGFDTLL